MYTLTRSYKPYSDESSKGHLGWARFWLVCHAGADCTPPDPQLQLHLHPLPHLLLDLHPLPHLHLDLHPVPHLHLDLQPVPHLQLDIWSMVCV